MFEKRVTRKRLGEALGVSGPNAGRKLRGEVAWSVEDVLRTAALLGVDAARLLPHRRAGVPVDVLSAFDPAVVGRAGLEPATQGL
ncbi:helix-turn-helix domain-containing protein [Acidipropionibacterium acidipropionici]|uniref:helix-turn-helix domain-containing protein n=1 Tax=Acidipropionibacterium acidipropionici TaxID=1748 RepID=UPI001F2FED25|nr:helix-turn-helix domain-containing protein [Acidipropionibacterium acidipropionici]